MAQYEDAPEKLDRVCFIHDNYSFAISDWCVEHQVLKLTAYVTDIEVWKYIISLKPVLYVAV